MMVRTRHHEKRTLKMINLHLKTRRRRTGLVDMMKDEMTTGMINGTSIGTTDGTTTGMVTVTTIKGGG